MSVCECMYQCMNASCMCVSLSVMHAHNKNNHTSGNFTVSNLCSELHIVHCKNRTLGQTKLKNVSGPPAWSIFAK